MPAQTGGGGVRMVRGPLDNGMEREEGEVVAPAAVYAFGSMVSLCPGAASRSRRSP